MQYIILSDFVKTLAEIKNLERQIKDAEKVLTQLPDAETSLDGLTSVRELVNDKIPGFETKRQQVIIGMMTILP